MKTNKRPGYCGGGGDAGEEGEIRPTGSRRPSGGHHVERVAGERSASSRRPASPRTSSAVESASHSVDDGPRTAAEASASLGSPVRGSRTWPWVRPPPVKHLPCGAETESAPRRSRRRGSASPGTRQPTCHRPPPGAAPITCTLLVPPCRKAQGIPCSRRHSIAASRAWPLPIEPRSSSMPGSARRAVKASRSSSRRSTPTRRRASESAAGSGRRPVPPWKPQARIRGPTVGSNEPPVRRATSRQRSRRRKTRGSTRTAGPPARALIQPIGLEGR